MGKHQKYQAFLSAQGWLTPEQRVDTSGNTEDNAGRRGSHRSGQGPPTLSSTHSSEEPLAPYVAQPSVFALCLSTSTELPSVK